MLRQAEFLQVLAEAEFPGEESLQLAFFLVFLKGFQGFLEEACFRSSYLFLFFFEGIYGFLKGLLSFFAFEQRIKHAFFAFEASLKHAFFCPLKQALKLLFLPWKKASNVLFLPFEKSRGNFQPFMTGK